MRLHVESLNHACVLLSVSGVRLLFDPWLSGTAFSGGWGLRYENPRAIERAADATHLWISLWHSDHMHEPTLRELARRRPDIEVLANVSHNFSMVERLRAMGFAKVVALGERTPLSIGSGVMVARYPTAGIDNMLHVAAPGASILNYNDCNLPERALRRLKARIGQVDLLLANYNHAGKLFERASDEAIQRTFFGSMARAVEVMRPRHVVPFASSHVYRSRYSTAQNQSLLDFDQLAAWTAHDPRALRPRRGVGDGDPRVGPRDPPRRERTRSAQHRTRRPNPLGPRVLVEPARGDPGHPRDRQAEGRRAPRVRAEALSSGRCRARRTPRERG